MTSAQLRAARGFLNWTVRRLAEEAGVHRNTISNFETGRFGGEPETITAIRTALEAAGVEFIETDKGEGVVKLRRS